MQLDDPKIQDIVERVVQRLGQAGVLSPSKGASAGSSAHSSPSAGRYGVFADLDSAVKAARNAFEQLQGLSLELRGKMIEAMREVTRRNAAELSQRAVEETGMGRIDDKINKNLLAANRTPGIESLEPIAYTGDHGLTVMERAPYGVIGSITPCTNATETLICNGIGMIAAGNSVVFNAHPRAKKVGAYFARMLNQAIVAAGGPDNLLCVVEDPTLESAAALMDHPQVALLVVTGGPAVVAAAMKHSKKVIAAGPGNPPCVVDETAHLERAARDAVLGASFDNNIVCVVEKELIAVRSIADRLRQLMVDNGAYLLRESQIPKVEKLVCTDKGPVTGFVGKDAKYILRKAGIDVTGEPRLIICDVDEKHAFVQHELLMPILPMVRVNTADEAIDMAKRVEHGFRHTAVMHSTNLDRLHRMARLMDCSIFVKNGPAYAGLGFNGEGYSTFTIASPTGEGLTYARHFTRERRCVLKDYFRIV